jgi:hypothetical protein
VTNELEGDAGKGSTTTEILTEIEKLMAIQIEPMPNIIGCNIINTHNYAHDIRKCYG